MSIASISNSKLAGLLSTVILQYLAGFGSARSAGAQSLGQYFDPPPGTEVNIDYMGYQRRKNTKPPGRARGYITVSPPKGKCLIVTLDDSLPDVRLCKKKRLSFRAMHLDDYGQVSWKVLDDSIVDPQRLTWPTPHRRGKAVVIGHNIAGNSYPVYVNSCKAVKNRHGDRSIRLTTLTGREFVVRLPDREVMLPQPTSPPPISSCKTEPAKKGESKLD